MFPPWFATRSASSTQTPELTSAHPDQIKEYHGPRINVRQPVTMETSLEHGDVQSGRPANDWYLLVG